LLLATSQGYQESNNFAVENINFQTSEFREALETGKKFNSSQTTNYILNNTNFQIALDQNKNHN
jgi:hypothetical protein